MNYLGHILILICIYMILADGLNLISGYGGMLSIGHAAFFGIGAYAFAWLDLHTHFPFILTSAIACLLTMLVAFTVAWPTVKYKEDFLILATFAFQILFTSVAKNLGTITGGPTGLPGIKSPDLGFGLIINSIGLFLILAGILAGCSTGLVALLVRSPFGRVLRAIREDEVFAQAAGKDVLWFKVRAFTFASALAGLAGCLYASYFTFIDPTSFMLSESVLVLSAVVVGGAGKLSGPFIGTAILVGLPECLRLVGLPSSIAANVRQILYGCALVCVLLWRSRALQHAKEGSPPDATARPIAT